MQLLTGKSFITVANINSTNAETEIDGEKVLAINVKLEHEISQLPENERPEFLKEMGLSISEAVRIFLREVVKNREIPFDVRYSANVPNAETRSAIADIEAGKTVKMKPVDLKALWDE